MQVGKVDTFTEDSSVVMTKVEHFLAIPELLHFNFLFLFETGLNDYYNCSHSLDILGIPIWDIPWHAKIERSYRKNKKKPIIIFGINIVVGRTTCATSLGIWLI